MSSIGYGKSIEEILLLANQHQCLLCGYPYETLSDYDSHMHETHPLAPGLGLKGPKMSASHGTPSETPRESMRVKWDGEHIHITATCGQLPTVSRLVGILSERLSDSPLMTSPNPSKESTKPWWAKYSLAMFTPLGSSELQIRCDECSVNIVWQRTMGTYRPAAWLGNLWAHQQEAHSDHLG